MTSVAVLAPQRCCRNHRTGHSDARVGKERTHVHWKKQRKTICAASKPHLTGCLISHAVVPTLRRRQERANLERAMDGNTGVPYNILVPRDNQ